MAAPDAPGGRPRRRLRLKTQAAAPTAPPLMAAPDRPQFYPQRRHRSKKPAGAPMYPAAPPRNRGSVRRRPASEGTKYRKARQKIRKEMGIPRSRTSFALFTHEYLSTHPGLESRLRFATVAAAWKRLSPAERENYEAQRLEEKKRQRDAMASSGLLFQTRPSRRRLVQPAEARPTVGETGVWVQSKKRVTDAVQVSAANATPAHASGEAAAPARAAGETAAATDSQGQRRGVHSDLLAPQFILNRWVAQLRRTELLGSGSFGAVYRAIDVCTGALAAVKIYRKP